MRFNRRVVPGAAAAIAVATVAASQLGSAVAAEKVRVALGDVVLVETLAVVPCAL